MFAAVTVKRDLRGTHVEAAGRGIRWVGPDDPRAPAETLARLADEADDRLSDVFERLGAFDRQFGPGFQDEDQPAAVAARAVLEQPARRLLTVQLLLHAAAHAAAGEDVHGVGADGIIEVIGADKDAPGQADAGVRARRDFAGAAHFVRGGDVLGDERFEVPELATLR